MHFVISIPGVYVDWKCLLAVTDSVVEGGSLFFGVVKFPLRLIQREEFDIRENLTSGSDDNESAFPPLLIQYEEGKFYCTMQKELVASLRGRKINAYPSIIVLKETTEYKRFMKYFGNVFIFLKKFDLMYGPSG